MATVIEPVGYFKGELRGPHLVYLIFFSRPQPMGQENDSDH